MTERLKPPASSDLGGIVKTADSALRKDKDTADILSAQASRSPKTPNTGKDVRTRNTPGDRSLSEQSDAARADEHTPEDESALESLGRAIGAPLSGEAADEEPRR